MIKGDNFKKKHRKKEQDFTRKRKWSFSLVLLKILSKSLKSLQNSVNEFMEKLDSDLPVVSGSSFTQARDKLSYTAFIELNRKCVVDNVYSDAHKRGRGFRILGIDGSRLILPNSEEVQDHFGVIRIVNNKYDVKEVYATCMASVMYDVLNDIAVDAVLA